MLFTNNQKNIVMQVPNHHSYTGAFSSRYMRAHPPALSMPNEHTRSIPRQFITQQPSVPAVSRTATLIESASDPEVPKPKLMKWGEPTWYLFHTIAEKIKPEFYTQYRSEIMNIIRIVCNTLPCPICANHATQYMQNINDSQLSTKEDLQRMLWAFHNSVNERKGQPFFPNDKGQLRNKYSRANTRAIIQNFIVVHKDKQSGFRMTTGDFYRNKNINMIKSWFIRYISIFEE
jgi:hypothetical protein